MSTASPFLTALRAELVAAAEREAAQRRRPRVERRWVLAAVAAAALVIAAIVVSGALVRPVEKPQPTKPRPHSTKLPGKPLFDGTVQPGVRYATRNLVPQLSFVSDTANWAALFSDSAEALFLLRYEGPTDQATKVPPRSGIAFWSPQSVFDPNRRGVEIEPPRDLAAWLHAHPDLVSGPISQTRLAGLPTVTFDARVRTRGLRQEDPECARFGDRCAAVGPAASLYAGAFLRVMVVQTAAGPVAVVEESLDRMHWPRIQRQAAPILRTLRFATRR